MLPVRLGHRRARHAGSALFRTGFTSRRPTRPFAGVAMVLTESSALERGSPAPSFELLEPKTGKMVKLEDVKGEKGTLVMVICNHCPFVVLLKQAMAQLAAEYQARGIGAVGISSNSARTHPQDGPTAMAQDAVAFGYSFPYLYDETQEVAKALRAMCTPEFYLFDADLKLAYHGRFDDARPGNGKAVTGKDLRSAMEALLLGQPVPEAPPSIGCNVKWHPGGEPNYF